MCEGDVDVVQSEYEHFAFTKIFFVRPHPCGTFSLSDDSVQLLRKHSRLLGLDLDR